MRVKHAEPQHRMPAKPRVWRPLRSQKKPANPVLCMECGALFHDGRWQWPELVPKKSQEVICPACKLIQNNTPMGFLTLSGDYFNQHREQILSLIRHQVAAENTRHPLNRLMALDEHQDTVLLTFTDMHLPKRIGNAIKHAHSGELDIDFDKDCCRATWKR
jgi:hypothetical protein